LIAKLFISFSLRSILLNIRTCFCLSSIILFHVNESLFVCPSFSIYGQTVFQTVYTQFFFLSVISHIRSKKSLSLESLTNVLSRRMNISSLSFMLQLSLFLLSQQYYYTTSNIKAKLSWPKKEKTFDATLVPNGGTKGWLVLMPPSSD